MEEAFFRGTINDLRIFPKKGSGIFSISNQDILYTQKDLANESEKETESGGDA